MADPSACLARSGAGGEELRHAGEHVVDRVRLADPLGKLREDLERGGSLAVHDPVGELPRAVPCGIEGEEEGDGRGDRPEAGQRRGSEQQEIEGGQCDRHDRIDRRLLDDQVEVVEPVPQNRHRGRDREPHEDRCHEREERQVERRTVFRERRIR